MKHLFQIITLLLILPMIACTQASDVASKAKAAPINYEKQLLDLEAKYASNSDQELKRLDEKAKGLSKKQRARIEELTQNDAASQAITKDIKNLKSEKRKYLASKHPDFAKIYQASENLKAEKLAKKNEIAASKQARESEKAKKAELKSKKEADRAKVKAEKEAKKKLKAAERAAKKANKEKPKNKD